MGRITSTQARQHTDAQDSAACISKPARIKIVLAYLGFYRNAGGERRILQLVQGLDRQHYDIAIITLRVNHSEIWQRLEAFGVQVIKLDQPLDQPLPSLRNPFALLRTFVAFFRAIRRLDPHILQVQGMNVNSLARLAGLIARVPVIVSVENWVYPLPPTGLRKIRHWMKQRLIYALDQRSQAIIAVAKPFMVEKQRLGVQTPCVVIPSTIDLKAFLRGRSVRPFATPLRDPKRIRLGFMGRLAPEKGARYAIEAMVGVCELYPQAELAIIGAGPEETVLRDLVVSFGLEEQVTFRGLCKDVCGELCRLDIFIMPSLLEAYAQVFLEAMAVGLPIVATRTVGSQTIFPKALQEDLVAPADAASLSAQVLKMLHDPQAARAQAAALHARGSKISCEKLFTASHDNLYRELLDARGINI